MPRSARQGKATATLSNEMYLSTKQGNKQISNEMPFLARQGKRNTSSSAYSCQMPLSEREGNWHPNKHIFNEMLFLVRQVKSFVQRTSRQSNLSNKMRLNKKGPTTSLRIRVNWRGCDSTRGLNLTSDESQADQFTNHFTWRKSTSILSTASQQGNLSSQMCLNKTEQ